VQCVWLLALGPRRRVWRLDFRGIVEFKYNAAPRSDRKLHCWNPIAAAIQDEVELPQRSTVWIAAISSNVFKLQQ
jgi:hypothetical protein